MISKRNSFAAETGVAVRWHTLHPDSIRLLTEGDRVWARNQFFAHKAKWVGVKLRPDVLAHGVFDGPVASGNNIIENFVVGGVNFVDVAQNNAYFLPSTGRSYMERIGYDAYISAPILDFVETVYKESLNAFYSSADYYLKEIQNNIVAKWYTKEGLDATDFVRGDGSSPVQYGGWRADGLQDQMSGMGVCRIWSRMSRLSKTPRWLTVTQTNQSPYLPPPPLLSLWYDTMFSAMARLWVSRTWVESGSRSPLYNWNSFRHFYGEFAGGSSDLLHSAQQMEFLMEAYEAGILSRNEIEKIPGLFINNVWNGLSGASIFLREWLSGYTSGGLPPYDTRWNWDRWITLCKIDFRIWECANDFATKYYSFGGHTYYYVQDALLLYYVKYGTPKNFRVNSISGGGTNVELAWSNPSDYPVSAERPNGTRMRYFNIYKREYGQPWPATPYAQMSTAAHSFTDDELDPTKIYQYKIRCQDWTEAFRNESDDSNILSIHQSEVVDVIENGVELEGNVTLANSLVVPVGNLLSLTSSTAFSAALGAERNIWLYGSLEARAQQSEVSVGGSVRMRVFPGATLTFGDFSSIHIAGSLVAEGTSEQPITFTSSGKWSGITAENCNPSVTSLLNHARIEHAVTAVRIGTHTRLDVINCIIDDADIGIEFAPTAQQCPTGAPHVDVTDNVFTNIATHGIVVNDYSNLSIERNVIQGACSPCIDGRYGMFFNNASPMLLDNKIHGFEAAVVNVCNSSPVLQGVFRGGNNVLEGNGYGFSCDQSDAVIGLITAHNPDGGQNSILNGNLEAILTGGSTVFAVNNWWGKDEDPSYKFMVFDSKFDADPWLDRDPNEENRQFQRGGSSVASRGEEGEGGRYTPVRAEVVQVIELRSKQRYAEAFQVLRDIIAQRTLPAWLRRWAVRQTLSVGQQLPDSRVTDYLTNLVQQYPELAREAKSVLPNMLLHERRRSAALAQFNENILAHPNTPLERTALYEKFLDNLYVEHNVPDAATLLATLNQRFTDSPETKMAARQLQNLQAAGTRPSLTKGGAMAVLHRAGSLPQAFALKQNYPNPFNPSTTFSFELPEDANVSLIVYDVLGRKVAEVVNGLTQAGYRSAVWNASRVASGVYIVRFTAANANGSVSYSKTSKAVLMK